MKTYYITDKLKQDVVIPKIVQEKADDAFAQIQRDAGRIGDPKVIPIQRNRKILFGMNRAAAAVLAVLVCTGAVTVSAAAYRMWSSSIKNTLHVTKEQEKKLEDSTVSAYPMQSFEDAGVTVSSVQSIVDNQYAYLAFRVEGYDFSENQETAFDGVSASIDGKDADIYGGTFDGNEYCMVISSAEKTDSIIGKEVRVGFSGLGSCEKAAVDIKVDGNWELSWTLQGSDEIQVYNLSETLGDSGATLTRAEISPISLNVTCTMPRKMISEPWFDETNQQGGVTGMYAEPPMLAGVKTKDGKLYTDLGNGGSMGYADDESEIYQISMITNRILNAADVEALLFLKDDAAGAEDGTFSEEAFYVVPVE